MQSRVEPFLHSLIALIDSSIDPFTHINSRSLIVHFNPSMEIINSIAWPSSLISSFLRLWTHPQITNSIHLSDDAISHLRKNNQHIWFRDGYRRAVTREQVLYAVMKEAETKLHPLRGEAFLSPCVLKQAFPLCHKESPSLFQGHLNISDFSSIFLARFLHIWGG